MINWWLIIYLGFVGLSMALTMNKTSNKSVAEAVGSFIGLSLVAFLMYMAGIFTELWSVYK